MRAAAVAAVLAVATFVVLVLIFVDLHAATRPEPTSVSVAAPATSPPVVAAPAPPAPTLATPRPASPPPPVPSPPRPAAPPPPAPRSTDPLDRVVRGRTIRQWRAYYDDRKRAFEAEIDRHHAIVERAERGEEPDERELGDAHTHIAELRERLKQDAEELERIENSP